MATTRQPVIGIVDDDRDVATTLAQLVEACGFASKLHHRANTLIAALQEENYCALFLDLSLPDIDGIDLMSLLAAKGVRVPLILISGHSFSVMDAAATIARQLGLQILATLTKPIRAAHIATVLRSVPVPEDAMDVQVEP